MCNYTYPDNIHSNICKHIYFLDAGSIESFAKLMLLQRKKKII